MEVRKVDLHAHTVCSDGVLTPTALVAKARASNLCAIAITDHDCIDGLAEGMEAGRTYGVEVIAGVELSVSVGPKEVHLLGYFFDPADAQLSRYLSQYRQARYARAERMVERLRELGVPLSMEAVLDRAKGGVLGRPHVAHALLEAGHVATYVEAFERYLRDDAPAAVSKPRFPAEQAFAMLHAAGGIGVLAHPGHWTSDAVVMALVRAGLDGVETIHPSHDAMLTHYYHRLARDFLLVETGGCDYHGFREEDEERFGRFGIPYAQLERLRRRAAA
jgi:predicted metal-dependent phosphoesterase TrpH